MSNGQTDNTELKTPEGVTTPESEATLVLEKLDAESRFRKYTGIWGKVVAWIAIVMSVYHLLTSSGWWMLPAMQHRSVHLAFLLVLTFLLYPAWGKRKGAVPSLFDLGWLLFSLVSSLYILFYFDEFSIRGTAVLRDYVMGGIVILCVLEATRRSVGKELMLLSLFFLAYGLWGEYIPGVLGHTGFTLRRIIYQIYLSSEGIFGVALGVSATYIFLFVLFGAFLTETGMGAFIKDLAVCLAGRTIGGEAKVAVVASGLMGMINGSAVGNVAATGTFTIPMMRDAGFKPVFSAAVVAVAGTGGMIMPPVMGAASFIMAEYLGIHYGKIMLAAALPAILYYISELAYVHIEAKKLGMKRVPADKLTSFAVLMKKQGYQFVPIVLIVWLLLKGRTPLYAAFYGILSSVAVSLIASFFKGNPVATLKSYVRALEQGARQSVGVGVACAVVGNIIGITNLTGLGLVLGDNIVSLAEGNIFFTAFLTMVVSIILGMGLPTTACYIITATIAAPALLTMGVEPLAAHMFVFYFACLSNLTPPVAIASYGAAGISGQNPSEVGWMGFRISLAGFLIPFTFIYAPQLLFVGGSLGDVALAAVSGLIGVIAVAAALQGYLLAPINLFCRILLFVGACCLIFPGLVTDLTGYTIVLGLGAYQKYLSGNPASTEKAEQKG